ncbi:type 3 dihydrofolate reductase [Candidatus Providencia siddallii]|uniref:Dihydrofolate reductase n=1 Tax=Candidatus Providencia siddallii TaxID=1715285 RepID=A0ABP1CDX0_9GAMM
MNISLITAMSINKVIGIKKKIPWNLTNELAWFKKNTLNKPIIMGRVTYESIGHPLIKRINIVISNKKHINKKNIFWASSIRKALEIANKAKNHKEIMIIGGSKIYQQFLPLANKLYLTQINIKIPGDTFFPSYNINNWDLIYNKYHKADKNNTYSYYTKIFKKNIFK